MLAGRHEKARRTKNRFETDFRSENEISVFAEAGPRHIEIRCQFVVGWSRAKRHLRKTAYDRVQVGGRVRRNCYMRPRKLCIGRRVFTGDAGHNVNRHTREDLLVRERGPLIKHRAARTQLLDVGALLWIFLAKVVL